MKKIRFDENATSYKLLQLTPSAAWTSCILFAPSWLWYEVVVPYITPSHFLLSLDLPGLDPAFTVCSITNQNGCELYLNCAVPANSVTVTGDTAGSDWIWCAVYSVTVHNYTCMQHCSMAVKMYATLQHDCQDVCNIAVGAASAWFLLNRRWEERGQNAPPCFQNQSNIGAFCPLHS